MSPRRRLAKLALTAGALSALLAAAAPAHAEMILVGNPATAVGAGVTEFVGGCDPASPVQGIDGYWYDIAGKAGAPATLTMDPTLDVDAYFYDSACTYLDATTSDGSPIMGAGFIGETEHATVPDGARYIVVNGFAGTGNFTLAI